MTRRLTAKLLILSGSRLRVCDAVILRWSIGYSYSHKVIALMSMEEVITQLCIDFHKGTTLEIDTNI